MYQNNCGYAQNSCAIAEKYEKKKRWKGIKIIGAIVVLCLLLSIVSVAGGSAVPTDEYIAVLDIMGTISENDGYTYDQQYLLDSVEELINDDYNLGLILHIDSPGGAVYQIDELYLKLMEYKETTGRPVYAAVESYAASGGYYEACAADAIYANRNAITGSIGVIMGEFLVSKKGIGYLILYGSQVFNLSLVISGIFILCIVATLMYYLVSFIEKKVSKKDVN